jgi:outer membrane protein
MKGMAFMKSSFKLSGRWLTVLVALALLAAGVALSRHCVLNNPPHLREGVVMNNSNRYFVLIGIILSLAALIRHDVRAQTPAPPKPKAEISMPPPIASQYVGVDSSKQARWTLQDATLAALENNLDIEIERDNVRRAQFDLFAARGVYDPIFKSEIGYTSEQQPNTFQFSGSNQSFLKTDSFTFNTGLTQSLEKAGGKLEISFNNSRIVSNTSSLETAYTPELTLTFTQPLLRNFKTDANRRQIRIAAKRLDLSDAQFRQQAIEIISRVQKAYWDLAFAVRDEEIKRDAVRLVEAQLANNQRQAEVGTLAPIDVISAATQLEARRQEVFQAMNTVAQAENALKALTVKSAGAELLSTRIVPIENFEAKPIEMSLTDALRLAEENRPEIRQFALQQEINGVEIEFQRNQTKPQIDLVASYGLSGTAGAPAQVTDQNGVPQPARVSPEFIGGYGASLGNLFNNDSHTARVGLSISLPLRNRMAKANLGSALATGHQLELQKERQRLAIEIEVRNAMQSVEMSRQRIATARAAREYAEQQLAGEEKKFAAGLSTTFLVLTRQTDLSQARGTELRAMTDYNKAVADLQKAVSTTLSSNDIQIKAR